jgi:TolB-like protein
LPYVIIHCMKNPFLIKMLVSTILMVSLFFSCVSQKPTEVPFYKTIEDEQLPTIAVIPFHSEVISKYEADAVTLLFETALQETAIFTIIEQTNIDDILSAQEYSLSECTDESCAVEIGKLLSARYIVLGSILKLGSDLFINTKIIDVQSAINVTSESIRCSSLEELALVVFPLANRLVGFEAEDRKEEKIPEITLVANDEVQEEYLGNMNDGLVAFYPFDGNANDESGNKLHGTVSGATLIEDMYGNNESAYFFNGSTDYIDCGNGISSYITEDFTISVWIKWDGDIGNAYYNILSISL